MTEKKSWAEFRESGFLWWINMILHTFGWAIIFEYDHQNEKITDVYPARVKFRGFNEDSNSRGYKRVSKYMKENSMDLYYESKE